MLATLPETNMETQKGPYKDYSPSKEGGGGGGGGYMGFHVSLGECINSASLSAQISLEPESLNAEGLNPCTLRPGP